MDQSQLVGAVEALTSEVKTLSKRLDTQQEVINAIKRQGREIRSTRLGLVVATFGVVLSICLAGGVGFLYQEVDKVQQRTDTQILCPLYEFLALSLKVNSPPPAATPEQLELRKTAADTIASGLTTLGCEKIAAKKGGS